MVATPLSLDYLERSPDAGVESESDALRLRSQLLKLKKSLAATDRVVVDLIEEWQEALEECERCERKALKLRREADEQDLQLHEWRQTAAECFRQVSLKLSSEALNLHWHTAPFVAIEHQQALQLQCWLLDGRTWRSVRLAIGGGALVYTRETRAVLPPRRARRVQVTVELDWIDEARADGDVIVTSGCCGVEPRWQWTCLLSPAGREICRRDAIVFCCETELGMDFWTRELHNAKGLPPPLRATSQYNLLALPQPASPDGHGWSRSPDGAAAALPQPSFEDPAPQRQRWRFPSRSGASAQNDNARAMPPQMQISNAPPLARGMPPTMLPTPEGPNTGPMRPPALLSPDAGGSAGITRFAADGSLRPVGADGLASPTQDVDLDARNFVTGGTSSLPRSMSSPRSVPPAAAAGGARPDRPAPPALHSAPDRPMMPNAPTARDSRPPPIMAPRGPPNPGGGAGRVPTRMQPPPPPPLRNRQESSPPRFAGPGGANAGHPAPPRRNTPPLPPPPARPPQRT